jgi:hypothetical protein
VGFLKSRGSESIRLCGVSHRRDRTDAPVAAEVTCWYHVGSAPLVLPVEIRRDEGGWLACGAAPPLAGWSPELRLSSGLGR